MELKTKTAYCCHCGKLFNSPIYSYSDIMIIYDRYCSECNEKIDEFLLSLEEVKTA